MDVCGNNQLPADLPGSFLFLFIYLFNFFYLLSVHKEDEQVGSGAGAGLWIVGRHAAARCGAVRCVLRALSRVNVRGRRSQA